MIMILIQISKKNCRKLNLVLTEAFSVSPENQHLQGISGSGLSRKRTVADVRALAKKMAALRFPPRFAAFIPMMISGAWPTD